jgi:hypothetical protein
MPHLKLVLASGNGPIIDVVVSVSAPRANALTSNSLAVPQPITVRGLIDTGASNTCIDPSIVTSLGLQPTGLMQIITPSTGNVPVLCSQYDISVIFPFPLMVFSVPTLPVTESSLAHQGFAMLIGRDILAHSLLIYDGKNNEFTFSL